MAASRNKLAQEDNCRPLEAASLRGEVDLVGYARGIYPGKRLPRGKLPGLQSVGYWNAHGRQSWGLPMHRNEGIEICYLLGGECHFATEEEQWNLNPGDITITRPWQRHCLGDPNIRACQLFWVILDVEGHQDSNTWQFPPWIGPDDEARRDLLRIYRKNQRCHLKSNSLHLKPFLEDLLMQLDQSSPLLYLTIADAINHLLLSVGHLLSSELKDSQQDPQGFDQTIVQFYHDLESSMETAAEPWTVQAVAHACRIGVTYLTQACKRIYMTTPIEKLNRIRLEHAARLLGESPALSITKIAFQTGFSSSQYFTKRFKRHYGTTPLAYRSGIQSAKLG